MENQILPFGESKDLTVPARFQNLKLTSIGAHGTVWSAIDIFNGTQVAIRKLSRPLQDVSYAKLAYREIRLMRLVDHPFIIKLLFAYTPQKTLDSFRDIYLATERMDARLICIIGNSLDNKRISFLVYQMLCGIKYLHSMGLIHRDLQPSNIAVRSDCSLKILDCGLARSVGINFIATQYVPTQNYQAPEVILDMDHDTTVDIWAIGCIMAELITGRVLLPGTNHVNQWKRIITTLGRPSDDFLSRIESESTRRYVENLPGQKRESFDELFPDAVFSTASEDSSSKQDNCNARHLLDRMLTIDPKDRITAVEALDHPYVQCWFDNDEVNRSAAVPYDHEALHKKDLSLEQWKELLFQEVSEIQRLTLGNEVA